MTAESYSVSNSADSAGALSPAARALLERRARLADFAPTLVGGKGSPESGRAARLSSWQQSIWFFDQMEPGCDAYNRTMLLRLIGSLDVAALERSLADIFRKHEVLRSRVVLEDGSPGQRVLDEYEFRLRLADLRELSPSPRAREYSAILNGAARAPFDLMSGPWARATLVRESDDVHALLFTAHHIAFDGWSTSILIDELAEGYRRNLNGKSSGGEGITLQYADFAESQRCRLDGSALDKGLDYWVSTLLGAPSLLELPADHPRSTRRASVAGTASVFIPAATVERLHTLGREGNATLFMTVLAAFQLWLGRLSGQDDIVVGTPVAGRANVASEKMIGCCMNVLPIRVRIDAKLSFRDLLRNVRDTVLQGLAQQEVPFDAIVNRTQPERDLSHAPLTQVIFNFRSIIQDAPAYPNLAVEVDNISPGHLVSDFEFEIEQSGECLRCIAVYNAELFDASTVTRWLGHFQTLLNGIIDAPHAPIARIPLLTGAERHLMVVEWNSASTASDYETCLHHLVEAQVRRTPDAPSVCGESGTLSYAALNRRANILARDLMRRGVGPGVLVAINMERCPDLVVAVLAVLKGGGAYVPLDPDYPIDRLAFMLSDSKPLVLLTQRSLGSSVDAGETPVIFVDDEYWEAAPSAEGGDLLIDVRPDDLTHVIYTSGSTGRPKGAMNTHRAVCNLLLRSRDGLGFDAHDVTLLRTPISFDLSLKEMFLPLIAGGRVVLARANDSAEPEYVARVIEEHGVTVMFVVPTLFRLLLDVPELGTKLATVRAVLSGAETLSTTLLERHFAVLRMPIYNTYGPTETAVDALHWRCERFDRHQTVPIGRPIVNNRIYILDSNDEPVPIGVTGEIYIGGAGVGRGYLNRPELTAEKFLPDPFVDAGAARMYRTGDLGRYDNDGVVEILGRKDDQVKLRGVRIELGEIEAVLSGIENVRECAVVLRDDAPGGRGLVAYIVIKDGAEVSETLLRQTLRSKLLAAMVPSTFVVMKALPLTPSGKIDRSALPAPIARLHEQSRDSFAPNTAMEAIIAAIWASVLNEEAIGIDDDFFELGGHSLNATRVMSQIREEVGIDAPLRLLFEYPTIRALSGAVDDLLIASQTDDQLAELLAEISDATASNERASG
ncbi:MAG: amino acid adenylation domain-containing protein [Gemmatimonadaceae bacterium]